jgi:hypothetical protein
MIDRDENCIQNCGGKTSRENNTFKTLAQMEGPYQMDFKERGIRMLIGFSSFRIETKGEIP